MLHLKIGYHENRRRIKRTTAQVPGKRNHVLLPQRETMRHAKYPGKNEKTADGKTNRIEGSPRNRDRLRD